MHWRRVLPFASLLFLPLCADLGAFAASAPSRSSAPAVTSPLARGPSDAAELEVFLDGFIGAQLEAHHIAGATVSVVRVSTGEPAVAGRDGSVLLAKGYGFADLKMRRRVTADEALFRIGSVSKLFVWTAVMQQVEQGKLDLDADVNIYLGDLQVPEAYGKPITLAHLMTHTPGFEDHVLNLFARDASRLHPLREVLAAELPSRVRPPGEIASYSNHGTALAAHIVERVSGMAWEEYSEARIIGPLGLRRTTFRQPVPEAISAGMSKGYSWAGVEFEEKEFEFVPLSAAGSVSTTAADMSRFMIAHLQQGRLGDARVLEPATAARMQSPLFRHSTDLLPIAHGFYEMTRNGRRVIGHDGGTLWFHTRMAILPDEGLGLFVSYNTDAGSGAPDELYGAFMDRYFPAAEPEVKAAAVDEAARGRLQRLAGHYRANRYSHTDLTKVSALFMGLDVTLADDGVLETRSSKLTRWAEVSPMVFREEHGQNTLIFREGGDGMITHLFFGDIPVIAFERVEGIERPALHLGIVVASLSLFVFTLVGWPAGAFIRRRHGVMPAPDAVLPRAARVLGWCTCLLFVVFATGMTVTLRDTDRLVFGIPASMKALLALPVIGIATSLGALIWTVKLWNGCRGRLAGRIHYTLLTTAFFALLWQLQHWNLLGFNY